MLQPAADEFRAVYDQWVAAVQAGDRAWFERAFAPDFAFQGFLRDASGRRRTVTLDKREFVAFALNTERLEFRAISVEAAIAGDVAVSWLLAEERQVMAPVTDDLTRSVLEKLQAGGGDTARIATEPTRALTSASWRREGDGWTCFSQQVVGVFG